MASEPKIYPMKYILLSIAALIILSCTPFQPAFSVDTMPETYPVKGRTGLLINQKLSFGPYATSKVNRSWTRIDKTSMPVRSNIVFWALFDKLLSLEATAKVQNLHFSMTSPGRTSHVYGTSMFSSEEILASGNPNSGINVLGRVLSAGQTENVFYVQVFMDSAETPWQLALDNQASQIGAKTYQGVFALDDDHYYTLVPVTKIASKSGPRSILAGSVGYEIKNPKGETVAGISLIDKGQVYFNSRDPQERFILANLMAALLLQENLDAQA